MHPIPALNLQTAFYLRPCAPSPRPPHFETASVPFSLIHNSEWSTPPFFPKSLNAAVSGSCPRNFAIPRRRARFRRMRNSTSVARRQWRGGTPACAHVISQGGGEGSGCGHAKNGPDADFRSFCLPRITPTTCALFARIFAMPKARSRTRLTGQNRFIFTLTRLHRI